MHTVGYDFSLPGSQLAHLYKVTDSSQEARIIDTDFGNQTVIIKYLNGSKKIEYCRRYTSIASKLTVSMH